MIKHLFCYTSFNLDTCQLDIFYQLKDYRWSKVSLRTPHGPMSKCGKRVHMCITSGDLKIRRFPI